MKNIMKKAPNAFTFLLIFTIIIAIFLSLFCSLNNASAKSTSSAVFVQKYKTLAVKKKIQYKIKNLKKTDYVRFSVSNSSLASIHKKTGWLTAKKTGKVTVTAKIYNERKQKIKTLQNTIQIIEEKNILPNAIFKVKNTINPWNFTITLSCNRILLKKEISSDKLTILPKNKSTPVLTASFTELSSDGKEITYTLSSSSQKKLCPGDCSMDGNYILESTRFSKKLSLSYEERLTKNTLSGFVLKENGNPIKNAVLSLKRKGLPDKICYTDKNGYYKLQNISYSTSLTAEKKGYQKKTITNIAISQKGTTCENIILRSSKESPTAIKFLVTDVENNPVSDASIYITSNRDTTVNANTFINKSDILYSGTTDSTGTLLLTNSSSLPAAPCSNLTLHQKASLSYSASVQFISTNTDILPTSILNSSDNYTIYVSKFSLDNLSSVYQTQKLEFSFSNLLSNQANIHIQLEKCPNVTVNNISLNSNSPLSNCHTISLRFFHPQQKSTFYKYSIPREQFTQSESKLNLSLSLPFALPDGTYYLSVHAISKDELTLAESAIVPITVKDSILQSQNITLHSPRFARVLAYESFSNTVPDKIPFYLYQKCDQAYFLIDTFISESFITNNTEYATSTLLLSGLIPNQSYLLLSAEESFILRDTVCFFTTLENTFSNKESAKYSITPITKVQCSLADSDTTSAFPNDFNFSDNYIFMYYHIFHNISQEYIRSSKSYPNCIMAFYRTNGTLLSLNLTIPPSNEKALNSSNKVNSIIDIYTNKEILITNQDSYF